MVADASGVGGGLGGRLLGFRRGVINGEIAAAVLHNLSN